MASNFEFSISDATITVVPAAGDRHIHVRHPGGSAVITIPPDGTPHILLNGLEYGETPISAKIRIDCMGGVR